MTDRELMQQALDALKVMRPACFAENTLKTADTAITALRNRLAQPEQTLTCVCGAVWESELMVHAPRNRLAQPEQELVIDCPRCGHCCPQPNQEPVAWVCEGSSSDEKHAVDYQQEDVDAIPIGTMLYAAPPQRPWVGLTEIEIVDIEAKELTSASSETFSFARAIEYKLKEKNT